MPSNRWTVWRQLLQGGRSDAHPFERQPCSGGYSIGAEDTFVSVSADLLKMKAIFWDEASQGMLKFDYRDIPAELEGVWPPSAAREDGLRPLPKRLKS